MEGTVGSQEGVTTISLPVGITTDQLPTSEGITVHQVQIIRDPSAVLQAVDEPGVAQTLLNISQPGFFQDDKTSVIQIRGGQIQAGDLESTVIASGGLVPGQLTTDGIQVIASGGMVPGQLTADGNQVIASAHMVPGQLAANGIQVIASGDMVPGQLTADGNQVIASGEMVPSQLSAEENQVITGGEMVPDQLNAGGIPTSGLAGDIQSLADEAVKKELDNLMAAGDAVKVESADAEEEPGRVAEDIRQQIRELCNQLSDLGEESFLVSVRLSDGTADHVGSIKGEHYCLLRQELMQDFHNFCLGIEDAKTEEDEEEEATDEFTKLNNSMEEENEADTGDKGEQEEEMETDTAEPPAPVVEKVITPKVIVLKKDSLDEKKLKGDHQYTSSGAKHHGIMVTRGPSLTGGKSEGNQTQNEEDEKENQQKPKTNVLFLCDICKDVFSDIKLLRAHKLSVHDEGDYKCDECPRIFSVKRNLERHQQDAHESQRDGDNRIICDTCVLDFKTREELLAHIETYHDNDLPMKCDVCEQTFPDIAKMMDHRKVHFDYDCFCTKCWQGFFDYLELETHIQSNCRYKEALYKCDICGRKYTKLASINKHIDSHPIHSPHACRMCGRGFESEKELKYHRTAAHIIRPFKCELCEKTFKKKESLIEHRRIHLRVKIFSNIEVGSSKSGRLSSGEDGGNGDVVSHGFECNTCGIVLPSQSTLEQHIHQHETAVEQHQCDRCNKVFFSHSLLTVHCRKEHKVFLNTKDEKLMKPDQVGLIPCDWEGCHKTFYDRTKWKYHMKYHEQRAEKIARGIPLTQKMNSTTCEICGKVLKYKSYLKAHMLKHSTNHPYQCDICGQAYTNQKRLADHIRVHKGEKPFRCPVCDKAFTSTSLRNQHMVIHWGHKTYICDVCGKGFMSRKHFHDHMRIHNGEQPHKCTTCGKDFIYYRSLVRHALTHIDPKERPKPYTCTYCGKQYTEVTGYKHHMRSVHTGENPFQCDICGDAFHRNDKLKRHMKSRHNKSDMKQVVTLGKQPIPGGLTTIVTTRRDQASGAPMLVKADIEARDEDLLQIVEGVEGQMTPQGTLPKELHVDVIQDNTSHQVFLIGLGNEGGETTYLQETQVIEGPDGVRYIIAGSGEELQVVESGNMQQLQEGEIIEGDIIQQIQQVEKIADTGEGVMVMNDGQTFTADQETLATLANMASVAEVADTLHQ